MNKTKTIVASLILCISLFTALFLYLKIVSAYDDTISIRDYIQCNNVECVKNIHKLKKCYIKQSFCEDVLWDEIYEWDIYNTEIVSLETSVSSFSIAWKKIIFQSVKKSFWGDSLEIRYFVRNNEWNRINQTTFGDNYYNYKTAYYIKEIKTAKVYIKTRYIWNLEKIVYIQEVEKNEKYENLDTGLFIKAEKNINR